MEISPCVGQSALNSVRLRLQIEKPRELRLTARAPMVNNHFPRHGPRYLCAEILLDQGERKIDYGGGAGRRPDRPVGDEDAVRLYLHLGKACREIPRVKPMGRCAAPVEQARLG